MININAYNQPGVEAGKKAAAVILEIQNTIESLLASGDKYNLNELFAKLDTDNKDSVFMIIRHMTVASSDYEVHGDWQNPSSISIRKLLTD